MVPTLANQYSFQVSFASRYAWSVRIYIAGINGMVGSAIKEEAILQGHEVLGKSSSELDFTNREAVFTELQTIKPNCIVIAAAKVGGIGANSSLPVDFLSLNLQIQVNLLDAAHNADIENLVFLGSSCIYPRLAKQPIKESSLLTGAFEPTNEPYAIAKIAGLKLVEGYRHQFGRKWISAMPTNLYGPRDNYDLESAHVLPAILHRLHDATLANSDHVQIWGDGSPLREFLHVEDLARAVLTLISSYDGDTALNVGSGEEISIHDLALLIAQIVGYKGKLQFDTTRPNGTPRKLLDSRLILDLGWKPQVKLEDGIIRTYEWFLENQKANLSK
jgi:GDP-L-fucose synthase